MSKEQTNTKPDPIKDPKVVAGLTRGMKRRYTSFILETMLGKIKDSESINREGVIRLIESTIMEVDEGVVPTEFQSDHFVVEGGFRGHA